MPGAAATPGAGGAQATGPGAGAPGAGPAARSASARTRRDHRSWSEGPKVPMIAVAYDKGVTVAKRVSLTQDGERRVVSEWQAPGVDRLYGKPWKRVQGTSYTETT